MAKSAESGRVHRDACARAHEGIPETRLATFARLAIGLTLSLAACTDPPGEGEDAGVNIDGFVRSSSDGAVKIDASAPSCSDRAVDRDETDVDCGGPQCAPCAFDQHCVLGRDCQSGRCAGTVPGRMYCLDHCSDGIANDDETDVDCGGPTCRGRFLCKPGQGCATAADCAGDPSWRLWDPQCRAGVCVIPCEDQVQDQDETDVDCGGVCVTHFFGGDTRGGCGVGAHCRASSDCACVAARCDEGEGGQCVRAACVGGTCLHPCSDGIQDYNETDFDCGHAEGYWILGCLSRVTCPACADGKKCAAGTDCLSGRCAAGTCVAPALDGGVVDGAGRD